MNSIDLVRKHPDAAVNAEPCSGCQNREIALYQLEKENSGLRRLIVELIEKNQQLREQMGARPIA